MTLVKVYRSPCVWVYALLLLIALAAAITSTTTWIDQRHKYDDLTSQSRKELARFSVMVKRRPMLEQRLSCSAQDRPHVSC